MIETLLIYYKTCILQHTGLLAAYKILQHLATRLQFLIISLKVITSTLQHQSVYCRGAPRWSFASSSAPGRNHGSRALKKKQRVDRLVIFPALGKIHKKSKNPKGAKFPSAPRLWNFSFTINPFVTIFTTMWHVNTCENVLSCLSCPTCSQVCFRDHLVGSAKRVRRCQFLPLDP